MRKVRQPALRWLWVSIAIVLIDQFTKYAAVFYLDLHHPVMVGSVFNLRLGFNTGAAFNFLTAYGQAANYFFIIFSAVVSIVMLRMLARLEASQTIQALSLAFILGGALGNLCDRIRIGAVVDFLEFHLGVYYWPAFNIADSAVCVGVVMMLFLTFFRK